MMIPPRSTEASSVTGTQKDPSGNARLRVLIAEDQYLMREGTRRLLDEHGGLDVVGVASDYDGVIAETHRLRPDVVLMDIKMPPTHSMEGIEAAHAIKDEYPDIGVIILSQHDDEGYVWALLEHGVAGYGYLHKVRVGDVSSWSARYTRWRTADRYSTRGSSRSCSPCVRESRARRSPN